MATNERRALLRHLGLKLLEHAAVEVREYPGPWSGPSKFAILRDFSEKRTIWMGDPDRIERDYSFVREGESFRSEYRNYLSTEIGRPDVSAYADHKLRVEGMFASDLYGGSQVLIYEVDKYGAQFYWKLADGRATRHEVRDRDHTVVDLRHMHQVKISEIRGPARPKFLWAYAHKLAHSDKYAVVNYADRVQQRLREAGYDPDIGAFRTPSTGYLYGIRQQAGVGTIRKGHYMDLRRQLKELGAMIASPETDTAAFVDQLATFVDTEPGYYFRDQMVSAWKRVHPDSELVQCSCGHLEVQAHVTEGRRSQTICRHCIESGRFRFLEDLQEYDQGGYQHGDGLYYSYEDHVRDEDDDDYDEDDDNTPGVRGYSTDVRSYLRADDTIKPSIYGDFLMGIELEVVPSYDRYECVEHTMRNLAKGYAILKNDGSLSDGGFEIVTAPRGLKEHIERFNNWKPHRELRAWDAGCCGMHVHMSSAAFTAGTLGKFLEFINSPNNDEFIRSIAGRHPRWDRQAEDYCQRDGCEPGNPKKTLQDKSPDRYHMVNTTNVTSREARRLGLDENHAVGRSQNTVEIRVFRASLKKARLLAQIEFAHAAVMFCRWSSMRELNQKHFLKWLKGMAGVYPNLAKWFGVRANTEVVEATPKVRAGADV